MLARCGFFLISTFALANLVSALAAEGEVPPANLPAPYATPAVSHRPEVIGWPADRLPTAPAGFKVSAYARDLNGPRWLCVLPNGDVLVAQSGDDGKRQGDRRSNNITLLRDADRDGVPEVRETFLTGLNRPLGMLLLGNTFYVGNTDGLYTFPYEEGQTRIDATGKKIVDLPAGGYNNHWTRNVIANRDGTKLYVSVGSGSNVGENGMKHETMRAGILEMNPDGSALREFATGLRNPVGMDWDPQKGALWTVVNERDGLGDDLVPDYFTSVREGGFYGWPYSYFGQHEDPRLKGQRPDLVAKAITPELPLGSHTASLGLVFNRSDKFPAKYREGAFIGQRGSWNRSQLAGYRVVFVPFAEGKPSGPQEDFLTGFIIDNDKVHGRPVGVTFAADGSLLVADELGGVVWRVTSEGN